MTDVTPDWKPGKRTRDPGLLKRLHRQRQACVLCEGEHGITLHHVIRRSQGGGDTPDNLVALCQGPGTTDCHSKLHNGDPQVRAALDKYLAER